MSIRAALPGSNDLLICLEERLPCATRRRQSRRQLEAELTTTLDSVQTGAILLDPAGRIRFINARFSQYFGMDHRQAHSLGVSRI